jgi:hypothetical protein
MGKNRASRTMGEFYRSQKDFVVEPKWILTRHAKQRMKERGIQFKDLERCAKKTEQGIVTTVYEPQYKKASLGTNRFENATSRFWILNVGKVEKHEPETRKVSTKTVQQVPESKTKARAIELEVGRRTSKINMETDAMEIAPAEAKNARRRARRKKKKANRA